jgi:L-seryl-tRNA(Ser) seleniumtransferase
MLAREEASLHDQALGWRQKLGEGSVIPGRSTIGGGSLPDETLPTWLLALETRSPQKFLAQLRACQPAVIARVEDNRVVFDRAPSFRMKTSTCSPGSKQPVGRIRTTHDNK